MGAFRHQTPNNHEPEIITLACLLLSQTAYSQEITTTEAVWVHETENTGFTDFTQPFSNAFWLSLEETSFVLSNSNNEALYRLAGRWSYFEGTYTIVEGILELDIQKSYSFSTNIGKIIAQKEYEKDAFLLQFSMEVEEGIMRMSPITESELFDSNTYLLHQKEEAYYVPVAH